MKTIKARGKRDFYRLFMKVQAVKYGFVTREIDLGAEILFYYDYFTRDPMVKTETVLSEDVDGNVVEKEVPVELTTIQQVLDRKTVDVMKQRLSMGHEVMRKHLKGLKSKGFFKDGTVAEDFTIGGNTIVFTLESS